MADQFAYHKSRSGAGRAYEEDLRANYGWALDEGGRHFRGQSEVHRAMARIALRLEELNVPYLVVGGMALLEHGYPRFTEDVNLLVTKEGLSTIHQELEDKGYRPPFLGSKNLRDTEASVRIEFIVTGEYPGDGRPKPVAFPDPKDVVDVRKEIQFINLRSLLELKLASGMSNPDRLKDLSDVQELAKAVGLSPEFAESLSPYVRQKFLELLPRQSKYVRQWPTGTSASELDAMLADGVQRDPVSGTLFTYDSDVARKHGLHTEDEYWTSGFDVDDLPSNPNDEVDH